MSGCLPNDEAPVANAGDGNKEREAVEEGDGSRPVPAGCARSAEDPEEDVAGKEEQHADGEVSTPFVSPGSEDTQETET